MQIKFKVALQLTDQADPIAVSIPEGNDSRPMTAWNLTAAERRERPFSESGLVFPQKTSQASKLSRSTSTQRDAPTSQVLPPLYVANERGGASAIRK